MKMIRASSCRASLPVFALCCCCVLIDADKAKLRCKFQRLKDTWIDFVEGHDVGTRRFQDFSQCERWCCQVEQCRHYTFNHDKYCYLRSSDPFTVGKQQDEGVHSGIKSSFGRNQEDPVDTDTDADAEAEVEDDDFQLQDDIEPNDFPSPSLDKQSWQGKTGFCSSLDGPYCMSINGLEAPPEVQEPKFNTQAKMPMEIESIVRQLKESFGKAKTKEAGVHGTFIVHGQTSVVDGKMNVDLTPGEWTSRPGDGNWITVGIVGSLSSMRDDTNITLNGRILIDGVAEDSCKPFKIGKLQRKVPTRARQETMRLRYDVANAGIPQVNGQYFLNGSSVDGSPRYSKLGDRAFTMLHFPSIETGPNDVIPEAWYLSNLGAKGIAGDGDDLDYYRIASTNQVAVPLTGWQNDGAGKNPAPSIKSHQPEGGHRYIEGEWSGFYMCNGVSTQLNLTLHCLDKGRSSKWKPCSSVFGSFQFGTGRKIVRPAQSQARQQKNMENTTVFKVLSPVSLARRFKDGIPFGSAEFGPALNSARNLNASLVVGSPLNGCQSLINRPAVKGAAVLIKRGGCMFVDKAKAAQDAGAALVVVVNSENMVMNMSTDELDEIGATIRIPTILVSKSSGELLLKALAQRISAGQEAASEPKTQKIMVGVRRELRTATSKTLQQLLNAFGNVQVSAVQGDTFTSSSTSDVSSEIMQALAQQMQTAGNGNGASELLRGMNAQVVLITEDGQQVMNMNEVLNMNDDDADAEIDD